MSRSPRNSRRAFTLIELMVSLALVLVLILGVNAIFKMASDTVNAGQALAGANRDNRAVQSMIYHDLETAVLDDGPALLIRSERIPAFRNKADEAADRDVDPAGDAPPGPQVLAALTQDFNNNNTEGEAGVAGEQTEPLVYNARNHRIDRLAFFANHLFRRQTGTQSTATQRFLDVGTSSEAYVWYGHLKQPDFTNAPTGPTGHFLHRNPNELALVGPPVLKSQKINNYYATDWILGRVVTVLQEHVPPGQDYVRTNRVPADLPARLTTPLSPDSEVFDPTGRATGLSYGWSTCDLADTSVQEYRGRLSSFDAWWRLNQGGTNQPWWERLGNQRFEGYPYPDRPLTPRGLARTVPVFVQGCTQFIVEYAGDFLAQDSTPGSNNGDILGSYLPQSLTGIPQATDGEVDFVVVRQRLHPSQAPDVVRKIRWYGMPRNTDAENDRSGLTIFGGPAARGTGGQNNQMTDVVPLRDALIAAGVPPGADLGPGFIEQITNLNPVANYAARGAIPLNSFPVYYAKWGPSDLARGSGIPRPKMLRITMVVDDPNGRMGEGQTYEYVINLP
jgi:prepilin-type N-terminal cleavage/methylation domain-containing protein